MKTGERMNVHLVYSALPLDERSQCIMKSPGSMPGNVRETGLSRRHLSTILYMLLQKGKAHIFESLPHFSSVFHSVIPDFQRLPSIHFRENWGKQEEIVCIFQSFVRLLKPRKGYFWQQKSQTQLQLYCVQNYGLDQDIKRVSYFLCSCC